MCSKMNIEVTLTQYLGSKSSDECNEIFGESFQFVMLHCLLIEKIFLSVEYV